MPKNDKDKLERKIRKRRKTLKIFVFILCAAGFSSLLLKSEYFNVKNVVVRYNRIATTEEVVSLSQLKGNNIFLIDKDKLKEKLSANPYIEGVEIKRSLPGTVILQIKEKEIKGLVKYQNSFVNIDSKGRMIQVVNKFPDGKTPLIEGIKLEQFAAGEYLIKENEVWQKSLEDVLKVVDFKEYSDILYSINIQDQYNIILRTKNGIDIKIGDCSDLEDKLTYAYYVLSSPDVKGSKGIIEILKIQSEYTAVFRKS
jgi:cell division protein FtsQ